MQRFLTIAATLALIAAPALAQTTTTVKTTDNPSTTRSLPSHS
jgi:Tfp pilus assembly protein FimT